MKKIGNTASGTVIVEMSVAQFDALMQIHTPQQKPAAQQPTSQPPPASKAQPAATLLKTESAVSMTGAERVAYVGKRIGKLKPKKKDALVHSIETMFHLTGGIEQREIERIISVLQKEKVLSVDALGKVTYREP